MATMVRSMALEGIEGFPVEIEAAVIRGQQQMISIIGLGDQAVKESGERMQAAMACYGYDLPKDKALLSLAPGNRRKRGSHYDLGMTLALLAETDQIAAKDIDQYVFIGELSLDGRIRSCPGVLSMITAARQCGIKKAVVPASNLSEARKISGIESYGLSTLQDAVRLLEGRGVSAGISDEVHEPNSMQGTADFSEVKGQKDLLDAVILAAAGGHNLLMIGEPGCGKSMIASRIPGILPEMTEEEALEVTRIQSIAGNLGPGQGLVRIRPFRAPHHNASLNALIGGGTYAQPGEVSLAHGGVLFLDELAEFSRSTLDALRQPLENRKVTISRVNGNHTYPANFMFIAAMNPCPCGYYPNARCKCTDYEMIHYRSKVSGPILERVDIQKWVRRVDYFDLNEKEADYTSAQMRQLVERARKIQEERFRDEDGVYCNAQMSVAHIRRYCPLDAECTAILKENCEKYGYSARVIHKLLRMARTAADVRGSGNIEKEDVVKVLSCRELDKNNSQMYTV